MGTSSRGNKPDEWAAKINHTNIINDPFIKEFINSCSFPKRSKEIVIKKDQQFELNADNSKNPIKHFLAIDGGYTIVEPKKNFPSAQFAFFQFGAVLFSVEDLEALSEKPFIFPEDMKKLHNLRRFKLVLPLKNILSDKQNTLKESIRKTIYDFFMEKRDQSSFMETLQWFLFEEYSNEICNYTLSNHPNLDIGSGSIILNKKQMKNDYTFDSPDGIIYLTDVFRLHEAVDEELGAGGILGYLTRLIEQLILVHFIRYIYRLYPILLNSFLFITDGPLSFSGQTANMHKPMRKLCTYLKSNNNLYLVGLEKSGPFVEHAQEICFMPKDDPILPKGKFILLSNQYIYKNITPGDPSRMHYGSTSYYGGKVIFHSNDDQVYVLTVPIDDKDMILLPKKNNYLNLDFILQNIEKIKCNMYNDSVIPIALVNKLVSLANHPSKILLDKFTTANLSKEN